MSADLKTERVDYEDGGYAEIQKLDGQNHGWWIVYNANGSKRWERHYQNGKQDGPERAWFPNGQLKEEWNYKNDELNGSWKTWHPNGQLKNECYFTDGEKDQHDRWYDPDGNLVAEQTIIDGVQHGTEVCTAFDEETGEEATGIIEYNQGKYVGFTPFPDSVDYFDDDEEDYDE